MQIEKKKLLDRIDKEEIAEKARKKM
jgi:hypothetical protein